MGGYDPMDDTVDPHIYEKFLKFYGHNLQTKDWPGHWAMLNITKSKKKPKKKKKQNKIKNKHKYKYKKNKKEGK